MISYTAMPGCCVGVLLSEFGGSSHRRFEGDMASADEMKNRLKTIGMYPHHNGGYALKKLAVVQAYLTTEQTTANEVLEEIGFTKTGTFKKDKHPDSDLVSWQMAAPKFQEWAEQYQPAIPERQGRFAHAPAAPAAPVVNAQVAVTWDEEFEEEDM